MIEPDWRAIAELQNAAMKKVYFVVGDDIDSIYHSGGGMNEYGIALQMYKEAVEIERLQAEKQMLKDKKCDECVGYGQVDLQTGQQCCPCNGTGVKPIQRAI